MTQEEKQKRAEEKALRRTEFRKKREERLAQLSTLSRYFFFFRYNVSARACPQEFFLFWTRQLAWAAPYIVRGIYNGIGALLAHIYFLPITIGIIVLLCCIFPPLLVYLMISVVCSMMAAIWVASGVLLCVAAYLPVFLAALKRRMNDVSTSATESRTRFVTFIGILILMLVSAITRLLSVLGIQVFAPNGSLHWIVSCAGILLLTGGALTICQMYYYSTRAGVKGDNFAGVNPIEVPMTEASMVAHGEKTSSRIWHLFSVILIAIAVLLSLAMSYSFLKAIETGSAFIIVLKTIHLGGLACLLYGLQALMLVTAAVAVFAGARAKKGDFNKEDFDRINACLQPRYADVTNELRARAERDDETPSIAKKMGFLAKLALRAFKIFMSPCYYAILIIGVVMMFNNSPIFISSLPAVAFVIFATGLYIHQKLTGNGEQMSFATLLGNAVRKEISLLRVICLWPFLKSEKNLPQVTKRRIWMRNVAFVDPMGLRYLVLGNLEMCGILSMFCILIAGIPVAWLWSIMDGLRYANMTDDEFLKTYPDYCTNRGKLDGALATISKVSQFIFAMAIFVIIVTISNSNSNVPKDATSEKDATTGEVSKQEAPAITQTETESDSKATPAKVEPETTEPEIMESVPVTTTPPRIEPEETPVVPESPAVPETPAAPVVVPESPVVPAIAEKPAQKAPEPQQRTISSSTPARSTGGRTTVRNAVPNDSNATQAQKNTGVTPKATALDSKQITVTESGTGKTKEHALRSAIRRAVIKATGGWVKSQKRMNEHKQQVLDAMKTVSPSDVARYEVLETTQEPDGTTAVKVKVTVSKKKIAPKLAPIFPDVFTLE